MAYKRKQRSLVAGFLAASLSGMSCGGGTKVRVEDERLARLPPGEREALVDRERRVRVAETDLAAAEVASNDAESFLEVVETERGSIDQRREGARQALELAQSSNDARMLADSQRALSLAQRDLAASDAKRAYARDMKELRDAEVGYRRARVDVERAELELAKVDQLRASGQGEGLDRAAFARALADARKREIDAEGRVSGRVERARQSRQAWRSQPGVDQQSARQIERGPRAPRPIERRE